MSISKGYRGVRLSWLGKYLLPRFRDVKLSMLTTGLIETWVMALKKTSLSPTMINHALRTLKIMLGEAVRLGYLASDPSRSVRQLKETPEARGILTIDEIRIAKAWDGDFRHYALNLTAASTGLRLGEVLGLTVRYVHAEYLEIKHAWGQVDGLGDPKWHKPRLVPLPSRTSEALQRVIADSQYKEPDDFLFYGDKRERPIAHQVVLRCFYSAFDAIGITEEIRRTPGIVFYSHRHGFNSYCRGKVPDERMTERYFHPGLEAIKELAKVQDGLLG
jgi:integrase